MEETINQIKSFFYKSPEYIYLIVGIVFLTLFIGVLKDKKWAIDPESTSQRFFYTTFGYKAFRIAIGAVFLFGTIAGFCGFYLYL